MRDVAHEIFLGRQFALEEGGGRGGYERGSRKQIEEKATTQKQKEEERR